MIDPSLLNRALADRLADVQTCSLGSVVSYDPALSTVDVQPLARRAVRTVEEGTDFEDRAVLPAVPLLTLGNDRSCLTLGAPMPGDLVLVVFCRESPAEGFISRAVSDPADTTLHSESHGFALPIAPLPLVVEPVALAARLETWLAGLLTSLASGVAPAGGGPITWGVPLPVPPVAVLGSLEIGGR